MGGRGTENVLSAFIGPVAGVARERRQSRILEIPTASIFPDLGQPRKYFDPKKITELAVSIAEYGVVQPIGVRPIPGSNSEYHIAFGERRWRASTEAGLMTMPCVIIPENANKKAIALIENLHRQDLSALEMAMAIKDFIASEGLSMEAVGKKLGLGKTRIHQLLNILNLPEEMLNTFCRADLNEVHARALLMLKKHPELQKDLFQQIVLHGITGQQAIEFAEQKLQAASELHYTNNMVADIVNTTLKKLSKVEKKWHNLRSQEREQCVKDLMDLKEKIEHLLANS